MAAGNQPRTTFSGSDSRAPQAITLPVHPDPHTHTYLVLALAVDDLAEDRKLERDIGIARVVLLVEDIQHRPAN
jgi:hypothetical protein